MVGCFLKNYFPLYVICTHIMKHLKSDVVETLKLRSVSMGGSFTNQKRGKKLLVENMHQIVLFNLYRPRKSQTTGYPKGNADPEDVESTRVGYTRSYQIRPVSAGRFVITS